MALQKGLYAEIFDNNDEMDLAIKKLSNDLSSYSLEAMKKLKKTFGRELIIGMIYLIKELKFLEV